MRMRRALLFWVFILVTTPVLQAQQPAERSSSRVTIAGETFYVHTVKPGETFYSLGKLYDTDEETIRARNPIVIDGLRPGQVLKIPIVNGNQEDFVGTQNEQIVRYACRQPGRNRLFDFETVRHFARYPDGR